MNIKKQIALSCMILLASYSLFASDESHRLAEQYSKKDLVVEGKLVSAFNVSYSQQFPSSQAQKAERIYQLNVQINNVVIGDEKPNKMIQIYSQTLPQCVPDEPALFFATLFKPKNTDSLVYFGNCNPLSSDQPSPDRIVFAPGYPDIRENIIQTTYLSLLQEMESVMRVSEYTESSSLMTNKKKIQVAKAIEREQIR